MGAETELRGTIIFDADTTEADKKIDAAQSRKVGAPKSGEDLSKGIAEALQKNIAHTKRFSEELGTQSSTSLKTGIGNALGNLGLLGGTGRGINIQVDRSNRKTSSNDKDSMTGAVSRALESNRGKAKGFSDYLAKEVENSLTKSIGRSFEKFGSFGSMIASALRKATAEAMAEAPKVFSNKKLYDLAPKGFLPHLGGKIDADNTYSLAELPSAESAVAGGGASLGMAAGIGVILTAAISTIGIIVKVGEVLKGVTESLIQFSKSLSEVSGAMAYNFAVFNLQIMFMKKRLGDELAPAMGRLLDEVVGLFKDVLPAFSFALRYVTSAISSDIEAFRKTLYVVTGGAAGQKPTSGIGNAAASFVKGFGEGVEGAANIATFGLLNKILPKVERLIDKFLGSSSNNENATDFMDNFHAFLVNEKSAQWQAAQTARNALTPQQQALYTTPAAIVTVPGKGTTFYPRGVLP